MVSPPPHIAEAGFFFAFECQNNSKILYKFLRNGKINK